MKVTAAPNKGIEFGRYAPRTVSPLRAAPAAHAGRYSRHEVA
jgi:hypothetical protein